MMTEEMERRELDFCREPAKRCMSGSREGSNRSRRHLAGEDGVRYARLEQLRRVGDGAYDTGHTS